ncbi:MAG: hypothetical protein HY289_03300 [Planctomycetes bacterium]|nr:hypothetical protein [Planctomycetota bacterium]
MATVQITTTPTVKRPAWHLEVNTALVPKKGSPSVRTWPQLTEDLRALNQLGDDWDGQAAKAPDPNLIRAAQSLVEYFNANNWSCADRVIAGVNGTIFFEWHVADGYIEIEVIEPNRAEGRSVKTGSQDAETFVLVQR